MKMDGDDRKILESEFKALFLSTESRHIDTGMKARDKKSLKKFCRI